MKIGIGIPNQIRDVKADVIPEWARRAEDAGFSTLGSVGRIAYPGVMDTVALAAAAGATSRIGLISNDPTSDDIDELRRVADVVL
ncbi:MULTISPECIES: LLM class flavin-dependent oxidoreductase [Streptomyces]|uniref:LLM class flavin-dependent oxidoreductase n=1 Tax=Streptomyces TaxID=1883 RepID=UPI001C3EAF4C|nr:MULTISPECIES: LLM class flavin-dependent oxidoreductase [Streptomyces]